MSERATDLWKRANGALAAARAVLTVDADSAASRAYYAAYYAVSARFALDERVFRKHSGVEAAIHRDLVKAGIWPADLGQKYSRLVQARSIGDYGEAEHVSSADAAEAIDIAAEILGAVSEERPEAFPASVP